jgi:hypothetical protein
MRNFRSRKKAKKKEEKTVHEIIKVISILISAVAGPLKTRHAKLQCNKIRQTETANGA